MNKNFTCIIVAEYEGTAFSLNSGNCSPDMLLHASVLASRGSNTFRKLICKILISVPNGCFYNGVGTAVIPQYYKLNGVNVNVGMAYYRVRHCIDVDILLLGYLS
jgi:hypothetical protein